jgi:hypothetical protein
MTDDARKPKDPTLLDRGVEEHQGGEHDLGAEATRPAPDDGTGSPARAVEGEPSSGATGGRPGGMGGEGA